MNSLRKLILTALVASGSALFALSANAQGNAYVGLSVGGSTVNDYDFKADTPNAAKRTISFDESAAVQLRAGYDFGTLRAEIEGGYREFGVDSVTPGSNARGDIGVYSLILKGIYDIETGSNFTPYVSLGAGVVRADGDLAYTGANGSAESKSGSKSAPAGQIGLGFSVPLAASTDLVVGYSLTALTNDDARIDNTILIQEATIGINYKF